MGKCYDNGADKALSFESVEEAKAEYMPYFYRGTYGNPFEEIPEGAAECQDNGDEYCCLHECCSHFEKGFNEALKKREEVRTGF